MLFNTAYGLAKENRPFTDFPTVCSIQLKNGLELGDTYITNKAAQLFTGYIAKTLKNQTSAEIREKRFVTVMSDGSTDTTIVEQEVVYVRYVHHGNPVTRLASIEALDHGNAEGVHAGVMAGLASVNLSAENLKPTEATYPTLVSANFDGAAVMMGVKSGVATRIQESFPWIIPVHCVAHKLELGILDGVKSVEYLAKFEAMVKKIYLFYHYSPKRRRELAEIAKVNAGTDSGGASSGFYFACQYF